MKESTYDQFSKDRPEHYIQVADTPYNHAHAIAEFASRHGYTFIRFYRVKVSNKPDELRVWAV